VLRATWTLHIGARSPRGLGLGLNPELGRQSYMEEYDKIKALLKGAVNGVSDRGEGGGTGTGAAPIVARISARSARSPSESSPSRSASRARVRREAGRTTAWQAPLED